MGNENTLQPMTPPPAARAPPQRRWGGAEKERRRGRGPRAGLAAHGPSGCLCAVAGAQEDIHQPHSTVSSLSMYSCGVGTKPFTFLLNTWMLLVLQ